MGDIHLQRFPELGGNKKRQQRSLKPAAGGWDTAQHYKTPTILGPCSWAPSCSSGEPLVPVHQILAFTAWPQVLAYLWPCLVLWTPRLLSYLVPIRVCHCSSPQPQDKATAVCNSAFFWALLSILHWRCSVVSCLLPTVCVCSHARNFSSADIFPEQLISARSPLHLITMENKKCSFFAPVCTLINICLVGSDGC